MKNIQNVVVFCASAEGNDPIYKEVAYEVGKTLAQKKLTTIYGGGKVGLMGACADGALSENGKVVGIIPDFMTPHEIAHQGVSELVTVESMHERKLQMHERSDAVLTLPGGFGTFEELFEILTWIQLGLYQKPVGILNVDGYYDALEKQLDHMVNEGLLNENHRETLFFSGRLEGIFHHFDSFEPQPGIFQIRPKET